MTQVHPEYMTVYSLEKARRISKIAGELGVTQKVLVKVIEVPRLERLANPSGFYGDDAVRFAKRTRTKPRTFKFPGVTCYPATDFSLVTKTHSTSGPFKEMMNVVARLKGELGIDVEHVNACGRNCVANLELTATSRGSVDQTRTCIHRNSAKLFVRGQFSNSGGRVQYPRCHACFSDYAIAYRGDPLHGGLLCSEV